MQVTVGMLETFKDNNKVTIAYTSKYEFFDVELWLIIKTNLYI